MTAGKRSWLPIALVAVAILYAALVPILLRRATDLFDRFWQATRTDRRGIGLGLSIVKALVEAHGGLMAVESKPGHGTTFRFSVPAAVPLGGVGGS